jgi:hypothetical protein
VGVDQDFSSKSTSELNIRGQYSIYTYVVTKRQLTLKRTLPAGRSAAWGFHTTSAALYFSTMKTCNGTLAGVRTISDITGSMHLFTKNNTTQTLPTTHEVQTANNTQYKFNTRSAESIWKTWAPATPSRCLTAQLSSQVFHIAAPLPVRLSHAE